MRAILLAAGYGTRLRPLTNTVPKCLMPIKGKPLLEIWLERLIRADVDKILINTHYLADQVNDFIESSPYKDQVTLNYEPKLLGTAGTLISNLDFFEGSDGLLIHADNYCLADLKSFIQAHNRRPPSCIMTMMAFRTKTPSECGIIEVNQEGILVEFHEKKANPPGDLANGAVYVISSQMQHLLSSYTWSSLTDFSNEVVNKLDHKIFVYETNTIFIDIGTPLSYAEANSVSHKLQLNFKPNTSN